VSVQLETRGDTTRRQELASLPTPRPDTERPRPVAERPRPRWREDVGAAVLLSVLGTLRDEDVTTSA
jgi:hypothetical protein